MVINYAIKSNYSWFIDQSYLGYHDRIFNTGKQHFVDTRFFQRSWRNSRLQIATKFRRLLQKGNFSRAEYKAVTKRSRFSRSSKKVLRSYFMGKVWSFNIFVFWFW